MRITRKLTQWATAAAAIAASTAPAAAAQVIIVIDGSGSSAGQIGGVAKIDIARAALRTILADSPADLSIGLVAYGHRQREVCSDIELMAEPGPADAFLDAAARVQSVGRSPIAEATAAAAAAITEDEATIIVITDNSDNCSPDPCATISALKDDMPGLTISVVGIAIPSDEVAEIGCFAELTGGVYLRADTAAPFQANLAQAMSLAWTEPGPPPAPMPVAAIAFPANVVQGQVFAVDYEGPLAPGDEIRIAWTGTPATAFVTGAFVNSNGAPVELSAPNIRGAFELRYWHAERSTVLARIPLRLETIAPSLRAPEEAQQGADIVVAWEAPAHGGETIQIVPMAPLDTAPVVAPVIRGEPTVTLPAPAVPGRYTILLVAGPDRGEPPIPGGGEVLARAALEIVAADIRLDVAAPVVAGRSFRVDWAGPGGRNDEIRLAEPGMTMDAYVAAAAPIGDAVTLHAPGIAGTYELRYWSSAAQNVLATRPIEISAATASLEAPAEIEGGATFEVVWTGDAAIGDRLAIIRRVGDDAEIVYSARVSMFGRPNLLEAPVIAGNYDLVYLTRAGDEPIARHPMVVTPPLVRLEATAAIGAGEPIEVDWQGPGGRFDEIRIVNADGETVGAARTAATPVLLTAPEAPGTYMIQYWAGTAEAALATIEIDVNCPDCPLPEPGAAPG